MQIYRNKEIAKNHSILKEKRNRQFMNFVGDPNSLMNSTFTYIKYSLSEALRKSYKFSKMDDFIKSSSETKSIKMFMLTAKTKVVKQVKKFSDNVGNAKKWAKKATKEEVIKEMREIKVDNVVKNIKRKVKMYVVCVLGGIFIFKACQAILDRRRRKRIENDSTQFFEIVQEMKENNKVLRKQKDKLDSILQSKV